MFGVMRALGGFTSEFGWRLDGVAIFADDAAGCTDGAAVVFVCDAMFVSFCVWLASPVGVAGGAAWVGCSCGCSWREGDSIVAAVGTQRAGTNAGIDDREGGTREEGTTDRIFESVEMSLTLVGGCIRGSGMEEEEEDVGSLEMAVPPSVSPSISPSCLFVILSWLVSYLSR